jgi:hypothetical protein
VTWADLFGYLASFLVFATFYMKRMTRLRVVAIASNVAFIAYAWVNGLMPILVLHAALLPLNVWRLIESRRLIAKVLKASTEEFSIEAILPLMQRRTIDAGDTLFNRGDPAEAMYYVLEGTMLLPEVGKELGPGGYLGEFALFSQAGRRTASAVAKTDCTLMYLTRAALYSALLQYPQMGVHLLKMVTTRMLENAARQQPDPGAPRG